MRKLVALLVVASLFTGCAQGMVRGAAIKPAVDLIVPDYVTLLEQVRDMSIPENQDLKKTAEELKAVVDLAAKGDE